LVLCRCGDRNLEPGHRNDSEQINGVAIWRSADALKALKNKPNLEVLKAISKDQFRYNIYCSDDAELNLALESYLFFIMQRHYGEDASAKTSYSTVGRASGME